MHIVWGTTSKPESSKLLAEGFSNIEDENSTLYIGYPILRGLEYTNTIDALLISKSKGVVAIQVVEGRNLDDVESIQEDLYSKIYAKLFSNRSLTKKKKPLFNLEIVTFAPTCQISNYDEDYPVFTDTKSLNSWLNNLDEANQDIFELLVSTVQSLTNIRGKRVKRKSDDVDSRASKLNSLDESIANLDSRQSSAVIETIEGVQRIRGLAGSGKTIILALKVAYLHASSDWNITVTFNTRSLKGQFLRLINTFYIDQTGEEPDWSKIHILHAWGSSGEDNRGIYYETCINSGVEYLDFGSAKNRFGYDGAFDGACKEALKYIEEHEINISGAYDVILIDEAQDFSGEFLKLCHALLTKPKRLVYAYDELQSLDEKVLPSPEELFGTPLINEEGKPKSDIILEKCYRNPRQILTAAHAIGFGIYTDNNKLIQMFDDASLWLDIGYKLVEGDLKDGGDVVLERTTDTSPEFLETRSSENDIVQFHKWDDVEEQENWIVNEIIKNIEVEHLRPEDIVVINPNAKRTRDAVGNIRGRLLAHGIDSTLVGVSSSKDLFANEGKVAFSGIHRAKGNEAGMVYIINAQYCFSGWELAKKRNTLFTAMTRAKAWVRVSGVGDNMQGLVDEFDKLKVNNFTLNFKYPTVEERTEIRTINRDLSGEEKRKIKYKSKQFEQTINEFLSGQLKLDDISEEAKEKLLNMLKK